MNMKCFFNILIAIRKVNFLNFFRVLAICCLQLSPGLYAASQQVVVAKKPLERGHVLLRSDLELKTPERSGGRSVWLTNIEEATGMTLKRNLQQGQSVSRAHLGSPVLVERGQRVLIVAEQNGIEARAPGEAMKKGRKGEIIKVRNESSQRVVSATVVDDGLVRIPDRGGN